MFVQSRVASVTTGPASPGHTPEDPPWPRKSATPSQDVDGQPVLGIAADGRGSLSEAFPWEVAPRFLIRERDHVYESAFKDPHWGLDNLTPLEFARGHNSVTAHAA